MRFIFTDEERWCEDETQDGAWLSKQTGWWFPDGRILIWTKDQPKLRQIGVAVHEGLEYIMIWKGGFNGNVVHWIANIFEFVASLGRADLSWARQDWKKIRKT